MAASDNHLVTLSGLDKFKECIGESFVPSGGYIVNCVIGNMNVSSVATSLTANGSETIIYNNTGSSAITVSFATGDHIVFMDGNDCMEIPAGGYGEVNFLRIGGFNGVVHVFVRSAVSE